MVRTELIELKKLEPNKGQIPGLPGNPRCIRKNKLDKLVKSLQKNPEMLELRELVAVERQGKLVVIMGNMRLRAMRELKWEKALVKILPEDTPVENLKAYTIKDNASFGEWDTEALANEWDVDSLADWGLDVPTPPKGEPAEREQAKIFEVKCTFNVMERAAEFFGEVSARVEQLGGSAEIKSR